MSSENSFTVFDPFVAKLNVEFLKRIHAIIPTVSTATSKTLLATVDWDNSTIAGEIKPFVYKNTNQIVTIPVNSVIFNVVLRQVGNDVNDPYPFSLESSLLKGSETVQIFLTNLNSNNEYTTVNERLIITPTAVTTTLLSATSLGLQSQNLLLITPVSVMNKIISSNSKQATVLCARFSGPAMYDYSKLQIFIEYF